MLCQDSQSESDPGEAYWLLAVGEREDDGYLVVVMHLREGRTQRQAETFCSQYHSIIPFLSAWRFIIILITIIVQSFQCEGLNISLISLDVTKQV